LGPDRLVPGTDRQASVDLRCTTLPFLNLATARFPAHFIAIPPRRVLIDRQRTIDRSARLRNTGDDRLRRDVIHSGKGGSPTGLKPDGQGIWPRCNTWSIPVDGSRPGGRSGPNAALQSDCVA
jgi:hypothetical protein